MGLKLIGACDLTLLGIHMHKRGTGFLEICSLSLNRMRTSSQGLRIMLCLLLAKSLRRAHLPTALCTSAARACSGGFRFIMGQLYLAFISKKWGTQFLEICSSSLNRKRTSSQSLRRLFRLLLVNSYVRACSPLTGCRRAAGACSGVFWCQWCCISHAKRTRPVCPPSRVWRKFVSYSYISSGPFLVPSPPTIHRSNLIS